MKKTALTLLIATLMSGAAFPVFAQEEQLVTADEMRAQVVQAMKDLMPKDRSNTVFLKALVDTYENNPTLKSARHETRAIFERLPQAEAGWRPTITADAGITSNSISNEVDGAGAFAAGGDDTYLTRTAALNLNQPLYRGGRTLADTETAQNVIRAQLAALDRTEQQVLLQAVTIYLDVLQNEALLKLATNNRSVIGRQFDATEERFDVGELTRTDVSQAEARLARAESDIITAQASLRSSRAEFERIIGYMPNDLGFPITTLDLPVSLESAVSYAEEWNPLVRTSQYNQRAAASDADSQFGNLLPQVALTGALSTSYEPSTGIDQNDGAAIGVVASFPLYEAGATRSRVREAKKVSLQRMDQISEAKRLARRETITAWENLQAAHGEVTSRLAQVEASEVARFGVKQEADLGARTILDTLDAEQELLDAQVALVVATRNEVVATYALAAALGVLTPKTLGFGEKVPDYNREVEKVRRNLFGTGVDSQE